MFSPDFTGLLSEAVGPENARIVTDAFGADPSVSIRLNPAKLHEVPFEGAAPVPWSPFGYLLPERPSFTLDPLFHAGCYYVQDSSAMFVGELFRRTAGSDVRTVLDLCAAPGGKTTDLAASLREHRGDDYLLVANEVMHNRFRILQENVSIWGDPQVGVLSRDPSAFPQRAVFDAIVADVPCSGEGMFRKDAGAVADWSLKTVDFCAARQRRILSDIWPSLKEGGLLVYSTCTFNRRENDENVAWIAAELGAEILDAGDICDVYRTEHGYVLLPGRVPGEGQYAAALRKTAPALMPGKKNPLDEMGVRFPVVPFEGPRWEVDRATALHYLHGDALSLPEAPLGVITLTFSGHPLGMAKNLGKRCNNLYPKERRIKMDIKI